MKIYTELKKKTMKVFRIIGIDPLHYNEIKYNAYIEWVIKNTTTTKELQLCLMDKSLQKYFMSQLTSIEINYLTHLQVFKKHQTGQQKLDLYFDYLKRFDCFFPKALKPKVISKPKIERYAYN